MLMIDIFIYDINLLYVFIIKFLKAKIFKKHYAFLYLYKSAKKGVHSISPEDLP